MSDRFRLLYLVNREALSSVFQAQVVTPLRAHHEISDTRLGVLTPLGHLWRKQYKGKLGSLTNQCRSEGITVDWIPSPPTRMRWLWKDSKKLCRWIKSRYQTDEEFIVRCRNAEMTVIASDALSTFPGAKLVYDCRGDEISEISERQIDSNKTEDLSVLRARMIERLAIEASKGITVVSHAMKSVLDSRHSITKDKSIQVIPCCTDVKSHQQHHVKRESIRHELRLSEKYVVTYLGSLAWYQFPKAAIRIFCLIRTVLPNAHFLAITTDPEQMHALLLEAGIDTRESTVISLPANKVPEYLSAADLGLLLRDINGTNRVASPVKFAEYMAARVPVAITPNLGDYSDAVESNGLGIKLDLNLGNQELSKLLDRHLTDVDHSAQREQCYKYALGNLDWSSTIPALRDWYSQLLADGE